MDNDEATLSAAEFATKVVALVGPAGNNPGPVIAGLALATAACIGPLPRDTWDTVLKSFAEVVNSSLESISDGM